MGSWGSRGQTGIRGLYVRQTHIRYLNSVASRWATCEHDYSAGFITNLCHVSLCGSCGRTISGRLPRGITRGAPRFAISVFRSPILWHRYISRRGHGDAFTPADSRNDTSGSAECIIKFHFVFVGPLSRRGDGFDYYNSTLPAQGHSTRVQKSTPKRCSANPVLRNGDANFLFHCGVAALTRNRALRRRYSCLSAARKGKLTLGRWNTKL